MKKIFFIALTIVILLNFNAHAAENKLIELRDTIFKESKIIRPLLTGTRDVILLSSLCDSCIMTTTQIDAYFSMLVIFNVIKEKDLTEAPVDCLARWLNVIKKTNELNIKSLEGMSHTIEDQTRVHVQRMYDNFKRLNKQIDIELKRVSLIKRSIKR